MFRKVRGLWSSLDVVSGSTENGVIWNMSLVDLPRVAKLGRSLAPGNTQSLLKVFSGPSPNIKPWHDSCYCQKSVQTSDQFHWSHADSLFDFRFCLG